VVLALKGPPSDIDLKLCDSISQAKSSHTQNKIKFHLVAVYESTSIRYNITVHPRLPTLSQAWEQG